VLQIEPASAGFYFHNDSRLTATRRGGQRHQFLTIELSLPFLEARVAPGESGLHPRVSGILANRGRRTSVVSEPMRLTSEHQQMIMSLRRPPVCAAGQPLWYQAKALEIAAAVLFRPQPGEELFCQRIQRANRERVEKVLAILRQNLAQPPTLQEIGRRVGCSHFYLSRIFTHEMGKSISAHLRDLRMERAAALLREGRLNVTQTALEVGYSSLSHFSTAFHSAFRCCPGLYPLATPAQRLAARKPRV
jgi:AraC-like DNA-binding protein